MLREGLRRWVADYEDYRSHRRVDAGHPMHVLLHEELPIVLRDLTPDDAQFKFEGSDGQGMITAVPWVAVFHKEITLSAKTGYYIVWLLPEDRRSVILELGLGATQFADLYGENKKALEAATRAGSKVLSFADPIAKGIFSKDLQTRLNRGEVQPLGPGYEHKAYGKAAVLSVAYPADDLPPDEVLTGDYLEFVNLYGRLVDSALMPSVEELVADEVVEATRTGAIEPQILEEREFTPRPPSRERGAGSTTSSGRYSRASKKIGDLGERLVFDYLKRRLVEQGREDLALRVVWEAAEGRTPGWDITTYCPNTGEKIFVEVKASQGATISEVILTRNEWLAAQRHAGAYRLYMVIDVLKQRPSLEVLADPAGEVQRNRASIKEASWALTLRSEDY